jgi:hypothetical protein
MDSHYEDGESDDDGEYCEKDEKKGDGGLKSIKKIVGDNYQLIAHTYLALGAVDGKLTQGIQDILDAVHENKEQIEDIKTLVKYSIYNHPQ